MTAGSPPPQATHNVGRSIIAVVAGLVAVVALSMGADEMMRSLGVFPAGGQAMADDGLFALAFAYRSVFTALGGYITAWLAPNHAVRHALILGGIGFVLAGLGVAGAIAMNIRPLWYPIALLAAALPLSWLGGVLRARGAGK